MAQPPRQNQANEGENTHFHFQQSQVIVEEWHSPPPPPAPQPSRFPHKRRLRNRPQRPHPADLPGDKQDCPVCYRRYAMPDADGKWEYPLRLDCGHVLGSECLEAWLANPEAATCPVCRGGLDVVMVRVEEHGREVVLGSPEVLGWR